MTESKKGSGCFFKGCLVLSILTTFGVVGVGGGVWWLYSTIRSHTAAKPAVLAPKQAPMTNVGEMLGRLMRFQRDVQAGGKVQLALSAGDLNMALGLAAKDVNARFRIENRLLILDVSTPVAKVLEKTPLQGLKLWEDRHLNMAIAMAPALEKGRVKLNVQRVNTDGGVVDRRLWKGMEPEMEKEINDQLAANPVAKAFLSELKGIGVQGDKLVIDFGE
ncbi:MAG: hypothetical protein PHV34_06005 [Verrucomicrobiae bacterium]|nr:hypothetical protein [Verrucomicrobiae bacterium]